LKETTNESLTLWKSIVWSISRWRFAFIGDRNGYPVK